jgi:APA family basic amino acid/polyamine antiporter
MAACPIQLLTMTLASNFGTFLLYALSCIICIVAFHNHPKFNPIKHLAFRSSDWWPIWLAWRSI